jgi:hypothetical protein
MSIPSFYLSSHIFNGLQRLKQKIKQQIKAKKLKNFNHFLHITKSKKLKAKK